MYVLLRNKKNKKWAQTYCRNTLKCRSALAHWCLRLLQKCTAVLLKTIWKYFSFKFFLDPNSAVIFPMFVAVTIASSKLYWVRSPRCIFNVIFVYNNNTRIRIAHSNKYYIVLLSLFASRKTHDTSRTFLKLIILRIIRLWRRRRRRDRVTYFQTVYNYKHITQTFSWITVY